MNAPGNSGQQLARLRHNEPEAVQIVQHFQQFPAIEVLYRVSQLAALAKGVYQIQSGLVSPFRGLERCEFVHWISLC